MKRKNEVLEKIEKAEKNLNTLKNKKKRKTKIILSTTFALAGAAVIITPIVIYKKENSAYEVFIESPNSNFQSYAMTLTRGATIANLKNKLVGMEGHILTGVYKDESCTTAYLDTDRVTKNAVVYLKYEKLTYSVSLPTSENFKILYSSSVDINKIEWGETFTFQVLLDEECSESDIEVFADDKKLTPDQNGFYQISFVEDDVLVRINGVEINTYSILNLPSQVTVTNKAEKKLTTNDKIEYGEEVTISFTESIGYDVSKFLVNGKEILSGEKMIITEDLNIEYEETIAIYKLIIPTISGCQIEYDESINLNNFHIGDTFTFKVVLEEPYTQSDITVKANQTEISPTSSGEYFVTFGEENVSLEIDGLELNTYTISNIPEQIEITNANGLLSEGDYVTYGEELTIRYIESIGYHKTVFKINGQEVNAESYTFNVQGNVTIEYEEALTKLSLILPTGNGYVLTYAVQDLDDFTIGDRFKFKIQLNEGYTQSNVKVKANGVVITQVNSFYEVTFNTENVTIEVSDVELNKYVINSIPSNVTIKDANGNTLSTSSVLTHGDEITLSYTEAVGYHKTVFTVNGQEISNNGKFVVTNNIFVVYEQAKTKFKLILPEITGVTYEYDTSTDLNVFETTNVFVFRIILDEKYSKSNLTVKANGSKIERNSAGEYVVTFVDGHIEITIEGIQVNTYTILSIPGSVTIKDANGNTLSTSSVLTHGDEITLSYTETPGYDKNSFTVNGQAIANNATITVTKDINVVYTETISYFTLTLPTVAGVTYEYDTSKDLTSFNISNTFSFKIVLSEGYTKSDVIVKANGQVITRNSAGEYIVTFGDEDITISIEGVQLNTYNILAIPGNVTVKDGNGNTLSVGSILIYGDEITLSYSESPGFDKNSFTVNGQEIANNTTITVTEDINVEYTETISYFTLTLPTVSGLTYEYDTTQNLNLFNIGNSFSFKISLSEGYSNSSVIVKANGQVITRNSAGEYVVTFGDEDITISIDGVQLNTYAISSLPENIIITNADGDVYAENDVLTYGEEVTITYEESDGYAMTVFEVNGETIENHSKTLIVTGEISAVYEEMDVSYLTFSETTTDVSVIGYTGDYAEITIPKTYHKKPVTSIGRQAFYEASITSITIPASVTTIETYAFNSCSNLTNVTFATGSKLQIIKACAFRSCSALVNINLEACAELETIENTVFYHNKSLITIKLPSSLKTIGMSAFINCSMLQTVEILGDSSNPSQLTTIEDSVFDDCINLNSINLEKAVNLTTIGNHAFEGRLTSVTIPASVTSIGTYAFYDCSKLKTVTFATGSKLQIIKEYAFYHIETLTSVNLEACSELETIESLAFNNTALTSIKLPASLKTLGDGAFSVSALQTVTILGSSSNPSQLTTIGNHVFQSCSSLTSINLENAVNLTTIGDYAFYGTALTSISIPETVTTVGSQAFGNTPIG